MSPGTADQVRLRRRKAGTLVVVLVGMLALGSLYNTQSRAAAKRTAYQTLESVADSSAHALNQWVSERFADADVMAENPLLRSALTHWHDGEPGRRCGLC